MRNPLNVINLLNCKRNKKSVHPIRKKTVMKIILTFSNYLVREQKIKKIEMGGHNNREPTRRRDFPTER